MSAEDLLSVFAVSVKCVQAISLFMRTRLAQSLGTSDHNTLIEQFIAVIPACPPEMAEFFLEANSWSLQVCRHSVMMMMIDDEDDEDDEDFACVSEAEMHFRMNLP